MFQDIAGYALTVITYMIKHIQGYSYLYAAFAMFMEGASIPFPGMYILIFSGFGARKMGFNFWILVMISSICYTTASLLPYYVGGHINNIAAKIFNKYYKKKKHKIEKVKEIFNKYGEWTICLSRPTFLGNYFSYIAGMNKMKLFKFLAYTFIGITPWIIVVTYLGYGIIERVEDILYIIEEIKPMFYIISSIIIVYGVYKIYKLLNKK